MFYRRLLLLRVMLLVAFLVILGRMAYLQLLQGIELRKVATRNYLRWVRVPAPRGHIYDASGRELATNQPRSSAWLVQGEVPRGRWPELLDRLTELGLYPDRDAATRAFEDFRRYPGYLPVRLATNLSVDAEARLVEELPYLHGVYLRVEPVRHYPEGAHASHLLGYLREIDARELSILRERGYRMGDYLGKSGIERAYERELRGIDGGEEVEVDAWGHVLRTLKTMPPRAGMPVTLTLDLEVQRAAAQAFGTRSGAAVALNPFTGDVLALVSAPEYDLNLVTERISTSMLRWLQGSQRPELNRATGGLYPPGSVFKIVTAAAALEAGKIKPHSSFYCDGVYHGIGCWRRSGHHALTLTGAIAQSCNVAFMQMAEKVGMEELADMAARFGFGQPVAVQPRVRPLVPGQGRQVGILPEQQGLVPGPAWAKATRRQPWQKGETLQVGIGQAALTVTPMQAACMIAAIANGGSRVQPRVVRQAGETPVPVASLQAIGLAPATLQAIEQGLRAVVGEGTARSLDPALRIAGKTGTAQNPGADHAWFVGYAPVGAPKVALAVIVEHGGHGGAVAAPIAEAIVRAVLRAGD